MRLKPLKSACNTCLLFMLIQLITVFAVKAQDEDYGNSERCRERRGLEYGGIAGIYLAGKATADFYSGKPGNENNVNYVFKNQYWYDEIYQLLDVNDTARILEYPEKMKYNPAFSFGLFAKYDLDCRNGIYIQFSYARLTAKDVVSIEVDPKEYLTEPDIRLLPIYGTEERNMIDLGFTHAFGNNKVARVIVGGGINMNNTLVKEHILKVESKNGLTKKDYNLVNIYGSNSYVPGGTQQGYEMRQGGIGFGIFGTLGVRLEFSPLIAIEPGFTYYYKQIMLEPGNGFTSHMNFYLRLCFRDLISFSQ
ncbi:MAG: hypothetical protein FD166_1100 [Bacteroidetes bacterium]|nr:MAG: hypothetical protein FD166_1100 [Bacteroidota bacterium]